MTKPTTVAALAVIVCTPALVSFATGNIPALDLALWYLVALVVVGVGMHVLWRLTSRYSAGPEGKTAESETARVPTVPPDG
jgi:hypothetical protein